MKTKYMLKLGDPEILPVKDGRALLKYQRCQCLIQIAMILALNRITMPAKLPISNTFLPSLSIKTTATVEPV